MTYDDTRLDAEVRQALTTLPVPDEVETRTALVSVLDRSASAPTLVLTPRHWRGPGRRWTVPVAAAAAVVAIAGAVGVGQLSRDVADREPDPAGASAVEGTWERRVPGAGSDDWGGSWRMTLSPDGVLTLSGPAGAPSSEGASFSAVDGRLRVDAFVNSACAELPAGVYTPVRADDALSLVLVEDPCAARADLFGGTWRLVP